MNNDGITGACRLVGAHPVEQSRGSYLGRVEKISPANRGQGAPPPGLPPPLGERRGHPRNFRASSKNTTDFYKANFLHFFYEITLFSG